MEFFSQYGQDEYLYDNFFKGLRGGFFIDIGASDGITISNTYFFEKYMGWDGICVEPRRAIQDLLRKNRTCKIEDVCISDTEEEVDFLEICGYGQGLSGIKKKYDPRHVDRIRDDLDAHKESTSETKKVKCITFSSLLEKYNVTKVDYMNIDVEGAELDIIKTIDFSKVNIKTLTIENNYEDVKINELMKSNGYTLKKRLGVDDVYVK